MSRANSIELVSSLYRDGICPHGSNILHQLKNPKLSDKKLEALELIIPSYIDFVNAIDSFIVNGKSHYSETGRILENYLNVLKLPIANCFESVTDFYTCAAPEFFLRLLQKMIDALGLDLHASGQKDIPIELAFNPNSTPVFIPRLQRVDIAVIKRQKLNLESETLDNFCIPIFVAESKTYFDKNMISGVAYSSEALKSTFPKCVCICIGEWTDFTLGNQSYAATSIDEIYIIRHQKRGDFRNSNNLAPISEETVGNILKQAWDVLSEYNNRHPSISERLGTGMLIKSGDK